MIDNQVGINTDDHLSGDPSEELELDLNDGPSETEKKGCCSNFYLFELFELYDNKFLLALGLQYVNTGMKAMTTLAFLDLFRT